MAMQWKPCVYFVLVSTICITNLAMIEFIMVVYVVTMNQCDPNCDFNYYQMQPLPVVETLLWLCASI